MNLHIESMVRSVEYRQEQIAHDFEAARNSTFWSSVRGGTGAFLIRLGERLEHEGDSLERVVRESRSRSVQPHQAA